MRRKAGGLPLRSGTPYRRRGIRPQRDQDSCQHPFCTSGNIIHVLPIWRCHFFNHAHCQYGAYEPRQRIQPFVSMPRCLCTDRPSWKTIGGQQLKRVSRPMATAVRTFSSARMPPLSDGVRSRAGAGACRREHIRNGLFMI